MGDHHNLTPMPGRSISADKLSVKTQDLLRKCAGPYRLFYLRENAAVCAVGKWAIAKGWQVAQNNLMILLIIVAGLPKSKAEREQSSSKCLL